MHYTSSGEEKALLRQSGASLVRKKKHEVYKLANGAVFVRACTPSDRRASKNNVARLKKLMTKENTK